jgi:hypothetical protein
VWNGTIHSSAGAAVPHSNSPSKAGAPTNILFITNLLIIESDSLTKDGSTDMRPA